MAGVVSVLEPVQLKSESGETGWEAWIDRVLEYYQIVSPCPFLQMVTSMARPRSCSVWGTFLVHLSNMMK